jgi:two-component system sensor histidine kinase KdpD
MSRLESGRAVARPEWVSLQEIVGAALHRLQRRLTAHRLETRLDDAPPLIFADPVLLEQLLFNLLENAAKYTPAGSRIVISARRRDSWLELRVADNGPGFPPEVDPNILFDKFQRGRAEGAIGGVGLGLAICRAVARAHGGDMRAERASPEGALFVTTLPLPEEMPALPEEEDPT